MQRMRQVLLMMLAAAGASCQPGCIVFFQKENVPGADPEARSFAFVDQVRGKTLILHGGNSVELDPLALEGMSEYQRDRLAEMLKELAPYPESAPRAAQPCRGLLVRHSAEPKEVLLSLPYVDPRHFCGLRAINLFPIRVEVPPAHVDVVEYVLLAGMAKLDPEKIADPARRQRYLKAEGSAKALGLGVWAPPGEQLLEAVEVGNAAEVERLLEAGAPANYVGSAFPPPVDAEDAEPPSRQHPLLNSNRLPRLLYSLRFPQAYRNEGRTPLMVAVQWWRFEIAQMLLRHGADVNLAVRDAERSWSPPVRVLHYAAQSHWANPAKRLPMLRMLVEAGADVRAADADQRLILFDMFSSDQWDVIDYLHSQGASIEAFDPKKHGPHLLARAAAECSVSDVARLIKLGADVNGLGQLGEYPLSVAAGAGQVDAARMLLDAGADPNRKDGKGRTPLERAKSRGKNQAMIELLTRRGAK